MPGFDSGRGQGRTLGSLKTLEKNGEKCFNEERVELDIRY